MLLATLLLIIGLFLVIYNTDRRVFAASLLCRTLNIPPLIVGMIAVSVLTSFFLYDGGLSPTDGIILLLIAVCYLWFIVKITRLAQHPGSDSLTCEPRAELNRFRVVDGAAFLGSSSLIG